MAYAVRGICEWLDDGRVGLLARPGDAPDLAEKPRLLLAGTRYGRALCREGQGHVRARSSFKAHWRRFRDICASADATQWAVSDVAHVMHHVVPQPACQDLTWCRVIGETQVEAPPPRGELGDGSDRPVAVIGAGWLGNALASATGVAASPRRAFNAKSIVAHSTVFVASGRSSVPQGLGMAAALRSELAHLREVLDACETAGARRVVVLGSSDVAGLAAVVTGTTAHAPVSTYAVVKAALEDECRLRVAGGMPVTSVRLAPVHGPGKARTVGLLRLARQPLIPLPAGGRQSIGFVLLVDAVRALLLLGHGEATPAVLSIGGGHTPIRDLLGHLACAQGSRPRWLPIPAPTSVMRSVASRPLPGSLGWLLRISLPREVAMEVPAPVTSLPDAAAMLVASC